MELAIAPPSAAAWMTFLVLALDISAQLQVGFHALGCRTLEGHAQIQVRSVGVARIPSNGLPAISFVPSTGVAAMTAPLF